MLAICNLFPYGGSELNTRRIASLSCAPVSGVCGAIRGRPAARPQRAGRPPALAAQGRGRGGARRAAPSRCRWERRLTTQFLWGYSSPRTALGRGTTRAGPSRCRTGNTSRPRRRAAAQLRFCAAPRARAARCSSQTFRLFPPALPHGACACQRCRGGRSYTTRALQTRREEGRCARAPCARRRSGKRKRGRFSAGPRAPPPAVGWNDSSS